MRDSLGSAFRFWGGEGGARPDNLLNPGKLGLLAEMPATREGVILALDRTIGETMRHPVMATLYGTEQLDTFLASRAGIPGSWQYITAPCGELVRTLTRRNKLIVLNYR